MIFLRIDIKALCCRILTKGITLGSPKHMEQCIHFTGEMAEEAEKLIVRALDLEVK
jgi:hypothetical protein